MPLSDFPNRNAEKTPPEHVLDSTRKVSSTCAGPAMASRSTERQGEGRFPSSSSLHGVLSIPLSDSPKRNAEQSSPEHVLDSTCEVSSICSGPAMASHSTNEPGKGRFPSSPWLSFSPMRNAEESHHENVLDSAKLRNEKQASDSCSHVVVPGLTLSAMADDAAIIARLAQNDMLLCLIAKQYPTMKGLLMKEPEGTLLWLREQGAIVSVQQREVRVQVGHEGTVGHEGKKRDSAWYDYLEAIRKCLDERDRTKSLARARDGVARHIHRVHYDKFPSWPDVSAKEQQSHVILRTELAYETDDHCQVMCAVEGDATVKDVRNASGRFYAEVKGQTSFKVIYTNAPRMHVAEDLVKRDPGMALENMEQTRLAAIADRMRGLTLDNL